jgi:hypothetical protein
MRTKSLMSLLVVVVAALMFASSALALPPAASPPFTNGRNILTAGTEWSAVFLYADAGDQSNLLELALPTTGVIFQNNNLGTYPIGMTKTFSGYTNGQLLTFQLQDLTVPNAWSTGFASTNVSYLDFATVGGVQTDFGVTLNAAAIASLNTLSGLNPGKVLIVGFEDRSLVAADKDYNDLIFAFAPVFTQQVPEPLTILLLGMGLVSLGVTARRRVKK